MTTSRRTFLQKSGILATGLAMSPVGYSILGANDRINVGIVGIRSRGRALMGSAKAFDRVDVVALCDVDSRALSDCTEALARVQSKIPKRYKDYRKMIEQPDLDAVIIASADHTHTPFAIYALQRGLHVYVEKPLSHNPEEGEWLTEAERRYNKKIQVGNQQRSAPTSIQAVKDIREGIIGDVHTAEAWYSNARGGIGNGKKVPPPEWLDWDLWQGPAPRKDYRDNIVHYNWHWFWHWGTGEVNNNGLHELDVCRWALGVDHPQKVSSTGGRYYFDDDWEFWDTQHVTYEYEGNKRITWEGHSCNNLQPYGRGRGSIIYGTEGSVLLDRNEYRAFNRKGELIKEMKEAERSATTDLVGAGHLVNLHMGNFFNAIRENQALNSTVADVNISNHMCHLANIAQKLDVELIVNPDNGKVIDNDYALQMWGRSYAPGWKPVL